MFVYLFLFVRLTSYQPPVYFSSNLPSFLPHFQPVIPLYRSPCISQDPRTYCRLLDSQPA